jgi:hypothetical protein
VPTPGCSSWTISFTPVKSNEKKREEEKDGNTKPHRPVISDSKIPSKYIVLVSGFNSALNAHIFKYNFEFKV